MLERLKVLIIADENTKDIGQGIFNEARKISHAELVLIPVGKHNGEEPPKKIAEMMKKYNVVVIATTKSLSHTNARRNASKNGVRIASMPGVTEDMMRRTLVVDYNKIKRISEKVYNLLNNKKRVRLVTKNGTDVVVYVNRLVKDVGIYDKKGDFGNLPAGEVGFAPVEGKTNGVVVIDKTMAGIGKLRDRVRMRVKEGFVKKIYGGSEAAKLERLLKKLNNKNVYNIAEFSIGTNYKAKITGVTLEDEKVYGTVHMALGDNTSYPGGTIKAPTHLDGVISKPTVFVDEKKIMEKGKLIL